MSPSFSQISSLTLHIALAFVVMSSQSQIEPLDEGQGFLLELQEGDIFLGETPLLTKKVEPLPPKKVVEKKVEKPKPLPPKEAIELPVKKEEVQALAKKEAQPEKVVQALPEKAQPAQKVVTQDDESFAKVVVPEKSQPVKEIDAGKKEKNPVAAATTTSGEGTAKEEAPKGVATSLPTAVKKAAVSEEAGPAQQQESAKPSQLVAKDSKNTVDAYGSSKGIRDARKLKQHPGNRRPEYPVPDRLNRRQGRVILLAYVTDQGKVEKVQVENAKATSLMTREAVRAFSRYRFFKGQKGWVRMPFEFRLVGPSKNMAARLRQSRSK